MNARKLSARFKVISARIAAVIVLVSAALPGTPLSEASANSNPVRIPALAAQAAANPSRVTQIAAGGTHSCALTPEGGVVCWGANSSGELGNGIEGQESAAAPVAVLGLSSGVMSLSLAWGRTCALTTLGRVFCWGKPTEAGLNHYAPVEVVGLGSQVVQLAVGEFHTCALTSSGKVLCWGFNTEGQLGNGTFSDSSTPVVAIASGAAQISVENYTSCAAMTNAEVKCWGDGGRGQLGDGFATVGPDAHKSNVPVRVIIQGGGPLTGATQVELGLVFGCAVVGSGVYCWGTNRFGSMRALWTAGLAADIDNTVIYNCAFLCVDNLAAFGEALINLMCGCGQGFSVEREYISKLPVVKLLTTPSVLAPFASIATIFQ